MEVNQIIFNSTKQAVNLDEKNVVFGIEQDFRTSEFQDTDIKLINNLILVGKLSIIKSKIDNANVMLVFEREMYMRKLVSDPL